MSIPPPRPPLVLVVDDEAPLRRVLDRALTRAGFRVMAVSTAEGAYEFLCSDQADALLLDIHLPTMSGLALYLAIVHQWPRLQGRVAIMSGDADAAEVSAWLSRHNCAVLKKPFDLDQVVRWVTRALETRDREAGQA